jgi:large subunit ribosomal protein L24
MKIKKGDNVMVMSGKDSGKKGKVESVDQKNMKVLLPELNVYKKHVKKSDAFPKGGILELSRPVNVANVMLICPKCSKTSRVGTKIVDQKKVRFCKKCEQVI